MGTKRDEIDRLLEAWAQKRRELLGIRHPLTASEYLGNPHCTLGARRDLHHGARSNRLEQHWPEFPFTGTLFLVNLAVKRMKPTGREIIDWHWTLEVPRDRRLRADLMGISPTHYWSRVARADTQHNYFRKVLADHPNVRWTFAFFHQPDWEHENAGKAFEAIVQMLQGRPHTVIAGHLHYYDYKKENGVDYITMGPAGASWHKNGPGNVDQILWVTMKKDGPEIAMITLDGIWDCEGRDLAIKGKYERTAESEGIYQEP